MGFDGFWENELTFSTRSCPCILLVFTILLNLICVGYADIKKNYWTIRTLTLWGPITKKCGKDCRVKLLQLLANVLIRKVNLAFLQIALIWLSNHHCTDHDSLKVWAWCLATEQLMKTTHQPLKFINWIRLVKFRGKTRHDWLENNKISYCYYYFDVPLVFFYHSIRG